MNFHTSGSQQKTIHQTIIVMMIEVEVHQKLVNEK